MVDEVNRGYVNPKDKLYQLKALQESNKQIEVKTNPCKLKGIDY
jgi:hypothetical protein